MDNRQGAHRLLSFLPRLQFPACSAHFPLACFATRSSLCITNTSATTKSRTTEKGLGSGCLSACLSSGYVLLMRPDRFDSNSLGKDFPGGPVAKTPHSQWRGPFLIQGTRFLMPQLRVRMPKLKIPRAAAKTRPSQTNK